MQHLARRLQLWRTMQRLRRKFFSYNLVKFWQWSWPTCWWWKKGWMARGDVWVWVPRSNRNRKFIIGTICGQFRWTKLKFQRHCDRLEEWWNCKMRMIITIAAGIMWDRISKKIIGRVVELHWHGKMESKIWKKNNIIRIAYATI